MDPNGHGTGQIHFNGKQQEMSGKHQISCDQRSSNPLRCTGFSIIVLCVLQGFTVSCPLLQLSSFCGRISECGALIHHLSSLLMSGS